MARDIKQHKFTKFAIYLTDRLLAILFLIHTNLWIGRTPPRVVSLFVGRFKFELLFTMFAVPHATYL